MNNKTTLVIAILLLVGILGAVFITISNSRKSQPIPQAEEKSVVLPEVDSSVGIDLKPLKDNKAVKLDIINIPIDTLSIEYELSYETQNGPKGAVGKIDLNGKTEISREILLGTCSKNTCTYDLGVKSVNLVLKFNSSQGASQFVKEYPLINE